MARELGNRIGVDPQELRQLIGELRTTLTSGTARRRDGKALTESKRLHRRLARLPVVQASGRTIPLETVMGRLSKKRVPEDLEPEDVWSTPPFDALGRLPVATSDEEASGFGATTLAELLPPFGAEGSTSIPFSPGPGNSYWLHASWYWWSVFLYWRYRAKTSARADGWEACDRLGGLYAQAKDACKTLVVPPPGDPSRGVVALIKGAACKYAHSAPKIPWVATSIETIVCDCLVVGADGSCDFGGQYGAKYELPDECSRVVRTQTAGPVVATFDNWIVSGVHCLDVVSRHKVRFTPRWQDELLYDNC